MEKKQIALTAQRLDLAREHVGKSEVVGSGRKHRRIGREGQGTKGRPGPLEPDHVFGRQVLCVSGRSPVAAEKEGSSLLQRLQDHRPSLGDRLC